jgi:inhibitor of cysteine peptidase
MDIRKRFVASTLAVMLAASIAAWTQAAAGSQTQAAEEKLVIGEDRNRQTVNVRVGTEVVIQLDVQMGTGYTWQLRTQHSKVAVPVGNPELKSEKLDLPGGPAKQLFRFKIKAPGSVKLQFGYLRPWLKDQPPLKAFMVTLHAE